MKRPGNLKNRWPIRALFVQQGQPLVKLANPKLELQIAGVRARLAEVNARLLQAVDGESADVEPLLRARDSANDELKKLTADAANLTVRARQAGIWVAPGIEDYTGAGCRAAAIWDCW